MCKGIWLDSSVKKLFIVVIHCVFFNKVEQIIDLLTKFFLFEIVLRGHLRGHNQGPYTILFVLLGMDIDTIVRAVDRLTSTDDDT